MKKFLKILIILLLSLIVLAGSALGVLFFGMGLDIFDRSGWTVTEDGVTQYLDYYGEPLSDWQCLEGNWYYFSPEGSLSTGWVTLDGQRYYLNSQGIRQSGWITLTDGTYYLSPTTGTAVSGWLTLDGTRYYLDGTGKTLSGWQSIDSQRYYLSGSGTPTTGWLTLDTSRYCFDADGILMTGWIETEQGPMHLDEITGALSTGWVESAHGRCYLNEEGYLATGWTDIGEDRYYLDENGVPTTGWVDTDEGTYYLDESGRIYTGWLDREGSRIYLKEDGALAIGKVLIDGTAYYFDSDGDHVLLVNGWNPVPGDYSPTLVNYGRWQVDASCYDALDAMLSDLYDVHGNTFNITSAYRSKATQQYIWDKRMREYQSIGCTYAQALAIVSESVAVPGTSEHHLGLAVDISGCHDWLMENCWRYGFIVRYLEGKTAVTGIIHEPWHYRYVGVELAMELKESGLTLEEYMDNLTRSQGSDAGTASNPELFMLPEE